MYKLLLMVLLVGFLPHLEAAKKPQKPKLVSLHLVDGNGFSETITTKERLEDYENVNFLKAQSYQKVLRVYSRDQQGNIPAFITTYHTNGQIKQYLEVQNSRANGLYHEWHTNGQPKLKAFVIGGPADLHEMSQGKWLFDNEAIAYDEQGNKVAELQYAKGELSGTSNYYYPSGDLATKIPYENGLIEGDYLIYDKEGQLLQKCPYKNGEPHGKAISFWPSNSVAAEEEYYKGLLLTATYYDQNGEVFSSITDGDGKKMTLSENRIKELQTFSEGTQYGEVTVFDERMKVEQAYHVKDGEKHGEEIVYYPNGKPKLSITWFEGTIEGTVKSWYLNGKQESAREISKNKKEGHLFAWYPTGDLMLIEEYDADKLTKGQYFKKGENSPTSQVVDGKGVATLYNKEGTLSNKINYENGRPNTI